MDPDRLRSVIAWSIDYTPGWDETPGAYLDNGKVGWGRSRRLGLYKDGRVKAYLGVQHIDPDRPGWGFIEQPECRFFLSLFVARECITLRTFPRMNDALDYLSEFVERTGK
jgi:hypothetical protein